MEEGARGVAPFVLANITLLLLLVAFPELILTPFRWISGG
jgi:TRAP-type C4-dicarboxylate transport system permease large subunit